MAKGLGECALRIRGVREVRTSLCGPWLLQVAATSQLGFPAMTMTMVDGVLLIYLLSVHHSLDGLCTMLCRH